MVLLFPSLFIHWFSLLFTSSLLFLFTASHFLLHSFQFLYYEQVIRFVPRFIIINKLDVGVKVMQPSGFGRESSTLHLPSQRLCAYHLPNVYSDRKVSVQPYGSWAKSIPFHVDEVGAMTLAVKREHHLATLPHVVTRSAPEYSVSFPPREIGLYLETDFFDKRYVRMCVLTYCLWLQFLKWICINVYLFYKCVCFISFFLHLLICLVLFSSVFSPIFFSFLLKSFVFSFFPSSFFLILVLLCFLFFSFYAAIS